MKPYSNVKDALLVEREENTKKTKKALMGQVKDDGLLGHMHIFADKFAVAEMCGNLV